MKGIREAALTKEELEIPEDYGYSSYGKQGSLFEGSRRTHYEETVNGQLNITVSIANSQIGEVADEYSEGYSYEKTIAKAEELANAEIAKLAGADWQKRYFHSIEDCTALWDGVEVEIKLIPIT